MAVRILPLAVGISAVVHAAVVALLATRSAAATRPAASPPPALIEVVTVDPAPEPEPLAVQLLAPAVEPPAPEPPSVAPVAPRSAAATRADPARRRDIVDAARSQTAVAPGRSTDAAPEPPKQPGLLAMRRGEQPRLALPAGRWDDLDRAPRGTAPERVATSGELREAGGGTYTSKQGVFDATVHADGTVELHDARNLNVHIALPTRRSLGRALASWYESDKGPTGQEGDTSMGKQIQVTAGSSVKVPDPTESQPKDREPTVIIPVLAGGFDVTDWLMRNHKQDPYDRRKLNFLDTTRAERVEIGKHHRTERLAMTPQIVLRSLEAVWGAGAGIAERKHALFELWDDCLEAGDPEVVEAAAAARRMIVGFIRARLPAGSHDAFTAAEIAALARTQHSHAVFQPYE